MLMLMLITFLCVKGILKTCKPSAAFSKTKLLTNQSHRNSTMANDTKNEKVLMVSDEQEVKASLNVVVVLNLIFVRLCLRLMLLLLDSAETRRKKGLFWKKRVFK